jgi:hypothetical protein
MTIIIIIFFIAIVSSLGMLSFRAWEIKTGRVEYSSSSKEILPKIYFRHIEKIMLYLAKYVIQFFVLMVVKYWFIIYTKSKKWICNKSPNIHRFFHKKSTNITEKRDSFIHKAVLESKIKIRNIKEKIKREHENKV